MTDATRLTPDQLDNLRARARRSGPFIDPRALRVVQGASFHREWAEAVLGHAFAGMAHVERWEITLLGMALTAEPERPEPLAARARREAFERSQAAARQEVARQEAERRAGWHQLRSRLPVPVFVAHNWTMIHLGHYQVGRDHIVVTADLAVGRLRRSKGMALCETAAPKKRRASYNGTSRDPLRGLETSDDGQDRIPTCKTCLKTARRIARPEGGDS